MYLESCSNQLSSYNACRLIFKYKQFTWCNTDVCFSTACPVSLTKSLRELITGFLVSIHRNNNERKTSDVQAIRKKKIVAFVIE